MKVNHRYTTTTAYVLMGGLLLQFLLSAIRPGLLGNWLSPLVSLVAAFLPFLYVSRLHLVEQEHRNVKTVSLMNPLLWVSIALFLFVYAGIGEQYLLDASRSDVIPTIQLFIKRLLGGAVVYDTITEFGYYLAPTYLPMHWLPFVVSEWIGLDARVWAAMLFFSMAMMFLRPLQRKMASPLQQQFMAYAPLAFAGLLLLFQRDDMGYSIELLLVGYYLLFCRSVLTLNPWLAAFSLICILLSRFSLVLWLPLAVAVLWQQQGYRFVLKVALPVLAGILLLYVWPFLSERPDSFMNAQKCYTTAAEKEWMGQSWQKPGDNPFQISRGFGFAWWFYKLAPGSLSDKILAARQFQLLALLLTTGALAFFYFRKLKETMPLPVFLLGSLHVYLWVFSLFIHVPYPYLFFIPLAVSAAWTGQVWLGYREEHRP
ncbi:MAG: hypothetical protein KJS92_04105 [Bacteroidetes bacterium]|nr:hypothetical protein [Bacteroidota bacterium]